MTPAEDTQYTDVWAQRIDSLKGASISLLSVLILGAMLVLMSWQWGDTLDELVDVHQAQLENQKQLMADMAKIVGRSE